jgi:hypothetical protein
MPPDVQGYKDLALTAQSIVDYLRTTI